MNDSGNFALGGKNALLAALPPASRRHILGRAQLVSLDVADLLFTADVPVQRVLFPLEGMISIMVPAEPRGDVEIALIGAEGIVGLSPLFGVGTAHTSAIARSSVRAMALTARSFHEELTQNNPFAKMIYRYAYAFLCATCIGSACAVVHLLEQRCARRLLMSQDRLGTDSFPLTHDALSRTLGVRRASVTAAVKRLQTEGVIVFTRGLVTIADRKRLEQTSCTCYERIRKEYASAL